MLNGGAAWRGWFDVGGELTSGRPDFKEGLYFGTELGPQHPAVRSGRPLHGPNLFPRRPRELGEVVLPWMAAMTELGERLLGAVAMGLGLEEGWFSRHVTADPTVLFRIFHYPPAPEDDDPYGVQEHTDYGLLTILAQDGTPGLQVHSTSGWIDVPADPAVFVVNLGDMIDRMTSGRYRSTAASCAQPRRRGSPLLPVLHRSVVGRNVPGDAARRRTRGQWRGAPEVGRRQRPRLGRNVRRLPHGKGGQGLPPAVRCCQLTLSGASQSERTMSRARPSVSRRSSSVSPAG